MRTPATYQPEQGTTARESPLRRREGDARLSLPEWLLLPSGEPSEIPAGYETIVEIAGGARAPIPPAPDGTPSESAPKLAARHGRHLWDDPGTAEHARPAERDGHDVETGTKGDEHPADGDGDADVRGGSVPKNSGQDHGQREVDRRDAGTPEKELEGADVAEKTLEQEGTADNLVQAALSSDPVGLAGNSTESSHRADSPPATELGVPLQGPVIPAVIRPLRVPAPPVTTGQTDERGGSQTGLTEQQQFDEIVDSATSAFDLGRRKQAELIALSRETESRIQREAAATTTAFTDVGRSTEARVGQTIRAAKAQIDALNATASAQIQASSARTSDLLSQAEAAHLAMLGQAFAGATAQIDTIGRGMRQELLALIESKAQEIDTMGAEKSNAALALGTKLAGDYRAAGGDPLARLYNKAKAQAAELMSRKLCGNLKGGAQARASEVRALSETVDATVTDTLGPLRSSLESQKSQAERNIRDAVRQARARAAHDGEEAGTILLELDIEANAALDQQEASATSTLRETTNQQIEQVRRAGESQKSRVRATATALSSAYPQRLAELQGIIDQATLAPDLAAGRLRIMKVRAAIDATWRAHQGVLSEQVRASLSQLRQQSATTTETLQRAADGHHQAATALGDQWANTMRERADGIESGINNLSEQVEQQIAGFAATLQTAASGATTTARESADAVCSKLREELERSLAALAEDMNRLIEEMPGKVVEAGTSAAKKEEGELQSRSVQLYNAMDGAGTEEGALFSALRGLDSVSAAVLRYFYQDHYKHGDLEERLRSELSGEDLAEALAHLSGNKVEATLASLENSIDWYGDNEAGVEAQLRTLSDEDLAALKQRLKDDPKAQALIDRVRASLGGADLDVVDALLDETVPKERRELKADAIRIFEAIHGMGTDEDVVYSKLEHKSEEQRKILQQEYAAYSQLANAREIESLRHELGDEQTDLHLQENSRADHSLATAIKDDFSGAEADLAEGHLAGDNIAVKAAKLELTASGGWLFGAGTSEEKLFETLEDANLTPPVPGEPDYEEKQASYQKALQDRRALEQVYKERYGRTIEEMITSEMGSPDEQANYEAQLALQYLKEGKGDAVLMLKASTAGLGTHEQLLKKALSDRSDAEIQQLREQYASRFGGAPDQLDRDLGIGEYAGWGSEVSGLDRHEVEVLMLGRPETPEDFQRIVDLKLEYQRSGVGAMWMDAMGAVGLSDAGEQLEWQKGNVDAAIENLRKNPNDPAARQELDRVFGYLNDDFNSYEATKNQVADAVTTGITIVGLVVATVLTKGAAAPLLANYLGTSLAAAQFILASTTTLAAGIASTGAKEMILGESYGWEAMSVDGIRTVLDAGLAGLNHVKFIETWAKGVVKLKGSKGVEELLQLSLTTLPADAIGALTNAVLEESNWEQDAVLQQILLNFAASQVSSQVSKKVGDALGNRSTVLGQLFVDATRDASGDIAGNLVRPSTWTGDADDIFWRVVSSAGRAAGNSLLVGGATRRVRTDGLIQGLLAGKIDPSRVAQEYADLTAAEKLRVANVVGASKFPTAWREEVLVHAFQLELEQARMPHTIAEPEPRRSTVAESSQQDAPSPETITLPPPEKLAPGKHTSADEPDGDERQPQAGATKPRQEAAAEDGAQSVIDDRERSLRDPPAQIAAKTPAANSAAVSEVSSTDIPSLKLKAADILGSEASDKIVVHADATFEHVSVRPRPDGGVEIRFKPGVSEAAIIAAVAKHQELRKRRPTDLKDPFVEGPRGGKVRWSGDDEAAFRGYPPAEEGHRWVLKGGQLEYHGSSTPSGETIPRARKYNEKTGTFEWDLNEYERLVGQRIAADAPPAGWTGEMEAKFLVRDKAEEGYRWVLEKGKLRYDRMEKVADGMPVKRRDWDPEKGAFVDIDTNVVEAVTMPGKGEKLAAKKITFEETDQALKLKIKVQDAVKGAGGSLDVPEFESIDDIVKYRQERSEELATKKVDQEELVRRREALEAQEVTTKIRVDELDKVFQQRQKDLTDLQSKKPPAEPKEVATATEAVGTAKRDKATAEKELADTRKSIEETKSKEETLKEEMKPYYAVVVKISEQLAEVAATIHVKNKYPNAELVFGGPGSTTQSGVFDQVWRVPGRGKNGGDLWVVVEAKGGSSDLGTKKVGTQEVQQGTREYFNDTVEGMSNMKSDPAAEKAGLGLESAGDDVEYLWVKAPYKPEPGGVVKLGDARIEQFNIGP